MTCVRTLATVLALAPLAGCVTPTEPELTEELPGEALDHAAWCPDIVAQAPRRTRRTELRQLGPCGDAVVETEDGWEVWTVDAGTLELPPSAGFAFHQLSPRGRIVVSHDYEAETVSVRELGSDAAPRGITLSDGGLNQGGRFGFVISKRGRGAQVWTCDADELVLRDLLDEAEDLSLASEVDCDTVTTSPLHSQLAFATLDDEVVWVDTDEQRVTTTGLASFERVDGQAIGTRRDTLRMSDSGAYLIHTEAALMDSDGFVDALPIREVLYDLELDRTLTDSGDDDWLTRMQSPVYAAPLFVVVGEQLFGVRAGELISIVAGINPYSPAPAPDGSIVVAEPSGAVIRYSGERFDAREVELPAIAGQVGLRLSATGQAGTVVRTTETCATTGCERQVAVLRQFRRQIGVGSEPGFELEFAGTPWVLHVGDDGAVLARGVVYEGEPNDEPADSVLLIGPDGTIVATYEHDPRLFPSEVAVLADGRLLFGLGHFQVPDELLLVDFAAGSIGPAGISVPELYDVERVEVDALGKRIAVALGGTGGVIWGELQ